MRSRRGKGCVGRASPRRWRCRCRSRWRRRRRRLRTPAQGERPAADHHEGGDRRRRATGRAVTVEHERVQPRRGRDGEHDTEPTGPRDEHRPIGECGRRQEGAECERRVEQRDGGPRRGASMRRCPRRRAPASGPRGPRARRARPVSRATPLRQWRVRARRRSQRPEPRRRHAARRMRPPPRRPPLRRCGSRTARAEGARRRSVRVSDRWHAAHRPTTDRGTRARRDS